jgi:hypothetical protein
MRRGFMVIAAAAAVVMMGAGVANAATGWAVQPTPNPTGATESTLSSISCFSATNCTAVGSALSGSSSATLAEHWDGSAWSLESIPSPTGDNVGTVNMTGVSCPTATDCTAVGWYYNLNGSAQYPIVDQWNGTAWTQQTVEVRSTHLELRSVSCHTADSCTATSNGTLALHWNGTAWRTETVSYPAGTGAQSLAGISCASDTDCLAVGGAETSAGTWQTVASQRAGLTWSGSSPVNPSSTFNSLDGVSCRTVTDCVAVGQQDNAQYTEFPLAESWNGSTWSAETTPSPANANGAVLESVSCPLANNCTAVGYYTNSSITLTLVEHWGGSKWVVQSTPNIPGYDVRDLYGVSCALATSCTAAGRIMIQKTGSELTLAEAN